MTVHITDGQPRAPRCRAFTLVELMVVIVIIGLLSGAVTLGVRSYLIAGKQNVAKMEITNISQALDTFYAARDRYPTNEEGIEILAVEQQGGMGALLNKIPRDPWGRPYQYNRPGREAPYEVICFGADGREGGEGADRDLSSSGIDDAGN